MEAENHVLEQQYREENIFEIKGPLLDTEPIFRLASYNLGEEERKDCRNHRGQRHYKKTYKHTESTYLGS